ncbi:BTAD domain-containing putative transcriptional regulator [Streptomyces sp. NPDC006285]|uniref:AfsR/SARP family transcriptional regulator n=1 Tax=Streptomyces sp. NPDC006285 TaxID=3364742 RepID=UPI0036AEC14F
MQFRILGAVEVQDERAGLRILPTGAKQRALLGALVVKAGQDIAVHRLVDELWGGHPPADAANALQVHVARLRRLLSGPRRQDAGGPAPRPWIVTTPRGYALRLASVGTDAARFQHLTDRGREVLPDDPEQAGELLRRALSLWRGPALEGSVLGDICAAGATLLEEQRLGALEMLYDACLRTGRHAEITGELVELTIEHPVRERFYDLLMVAFYRCDRQAEALGVYERARHRLVRELGVAPSPALRGRVEAILRHDPVLAATAAPRPAGPSQAVEPSTDTAAETAVDRDTGAQAHTAGDLPALREELARLHRRVERLQWEQDELLRRYDELTAATAQRRVTNDPARA